MKTVLVVEDDSDTRAIWKAVLAYNGYRVVEAADGKDGVRTAREERPDLIIMNLSMPHVDGLTCASLLRRDPDTADIPIIACTGFIHDEVAHQATRAGCSGYLEKPCEPSRLLREVARFIGPPVAAGG